MFGKLRTQLADFIAPTMKRSGAMKRYRYNDLLGLHGMFGSAIQLQQNKYGASLAYNMTVPVYTAVNARVDAIERCNWMIKDQSGNVVYDHKTGVGNTLISTAIQDFNSTFDIDFFGAWELSRTVAGETFIYMIPNQFGVVTRLEWLNPLDVQVYAPTGNIQEYWYSPQGKRLILSPDNVLFDRKLNLVDPNAGQSPVEVALRKAQTIINGDMTMLAHLRNNARAGMTISPARATQATMAHTAFDDEELDQIEDAVKKTMKGAYNHNSTVVLPFPVDINTFEIANIQPVIDLMDRVDKSIYEVTNVPPAIAGNPDTSRFQRSEQDVVVFHSMIVGELEHIEQKMNTKVMPTFDPRRVHYFEFDKSPFLHASTEDLQLADISMRHYGMGLLDRRSAIQMNNNLYRRAGIDVEQLLSIDVDPPQVETTDDTPTLTLSAPKKNAIHNHDHKNSSHDADFNWDSIGSWDIDNAIKELKAYRKFLERDKNRAFVAKHIIGQIFDDIETANDKIAEIDRQVNQLIDLKSLGGLETEFQRQMKDILDSADNRDGFFTRFNNLVTVFGRRAYEQGLMVAGVRDEPNENDRTAINMLQSRHMGYVSDFADKLFSDTPPTDAQMRLKLDQWTNKTLYDFYHEGILSGRANPMLGWRLNPEKENCTDCIRLDGQRHRALDWKRADWRPKSSRLWCNGDLCGCEFFVTVGRSRGNF